MFRFGNLYLEFKILNKICLSFDDVYFLTEHIIFISIFYFIIFID